MGLRWSRQSGPTAELRIGAWRRPFGRLPPDNEIDRPLVLSDGTKPAVAHSNDQDTLRNGLPQWNVDAFEVNLRKERRNCFDFSLFIGGTRPPKGR